MGLTGEFWSRLEALFSASEDPDKIIADPRAGLVQEAVKDGVEGR